MLPAAFNFFTIKKNCQKCDLMRSNKMILANPFGFKSCFCVGCPLYELKTSEFDFGKMTVFFKSLSFQNGLSYWALLGLEWKIFCHSLLICFHFFMGYWGLAAITLVRCPYIYFLDSIYVFIQTNSYFSTSYWIIHWITHIPTLYIKRKKRRDYFLIFYAYYT